jgi:hypothetical protein
MEPIVGLRFCLRTAVREDQEIPFSDPYPRVRGLRMGDDNLRQHLEGAGVFLISKMRGGDRGSVLTN